MGCELTLFEVCSSKVAYSTKNGGWRAVVESLIYYEAFELVPEDVVASGKGVI
jgi:hypothetical protein